MKPGLRFIALAGFTFCFGISAFAADVSFPGVDRGARLSRIIKDVKVVAGRGAARSARLNERIANNNEVRTGANARMELSFPDQTQVRVGANSLCNLADSSRSLRLKEGAVLFQAPDVASAETQMKTGDITISARGATGILERHQNYYVKILVLQGTARVYLEQIVGESVLVTPGQMLITKPNTKALPEAVHFDLAQLYKTSLLTNSDFAPLASRAEIFAEIEKQKSNPAYIPTNLVIHGRGTLVNLMPAATPTPSARKTSTTAKTSPAPKRH